MAFTIYARVSLLSAYTNENRGCQSCMQNWLKNTVTSVLGLKYMAALCCRQKTTVRILL